MKELWGKEYEEKAMVGKGKDSPRVIHLEAVKRVALDLKATGGNITINARKYPELREWAKKHNIGFKKEG